MTPLNIHVKAHIITKTTFFSSENESLLGCSKFPTVAVAHYAGDWRNAANMSGVWAELGPGQTCDGLVVSSTYVEVTI